MDPQRRSPRWNRKLTFQADDGFKGEVLDLSAVGMKVSCKKKAPDVGEKLSGTLTFENGAHVRIKVTVVRSKRVGGESEVGLEISEADKSFYDALPKLRKDTGETPAAR
jgi:hypothetical protein